VREFKGQALDQVASTLGLTGAGALQTQLEDGSVIQTLDVAPFVRRGRTQSPQDGIWSAVLRNTHSGADTEESTGRPFNAVGIINGYPPAVPRGTATVDIWLLTASVRQESGGGTIQAILSLNAAQQTQGWGEDDAGVAVVNSDQWALALWDTIVVGGRDTIATQESGSPLARLGIRMPFNSQVRFETISSEAAVFDCQLTLGIFPNGLGQDGIT